MGRAIGIYYWGEPLYGYYLSRDPWVMSRHVELFVEAGIDVLILMPPMRSSIRRWCSACSRCWTKAVAWAGRCHGSPTIPIPRPGTRRSGYTGTFMRREVSGTLVPCRRQTAAYHPRGGV